MGALLSFKGQLNANTTLCDSDGTPNPIGLYYKQLTTKYNVVEAYKNQPIDTAFFDVTDEDNVIALPVLLTSLISNDNDQLFTEFDEGGDLIKQSFYSQQMVEPCLSKIESFFKTTNILFEQSGLGLLDIDGNQLLAPQV